MPGTFDQKRKTLFKEKGFLRVYHIDDRKRFPPSLQMPTKVMKKGEPKSVTTPVKSTKPNVYLCGICKNIVCSDPKEYNEFCLGCDKCPLWFHFKRVGIPVGVNPDNFDRWFCPLCSE